ncbi:MAG: hypothetical protein KKD74_07140 [Bacteroidetes bacterium]|nr:hypothetical protein [Bacteroidota bacterium]
MQPLQSDTSYHIFNHANGFEKLFLHEANYHYFLEKYILYINPIAETLSYCLMPNHFHIVVRIREREVLEAVMRGRLQGEEQLAAQTFSKVSNFGKGLHEGISAPEISRFLSRQFSNLFSCYTQSFNKVYHRRGSLFIKNFKREIIGNTDYLQNAIVYVHRNPVHHGFCEAFETWPYSSYNDILLKKNGITNHQHCIDLFGGLGHWQQAHQKSLENIPLYRLLTAIET